MKNTFIRWAFLLFTLVITANTQAIEVLVYSNDFSSIETLNSGSSSTVATSSDGKYAVVQGNTTPSGAAVMGKTAYFTNTSSTGHMLFYDIPLNNGGRIVVTWGSTKRNLNVNCNTTLLTGSPVSYTGSLQTSTFTIPSSETGLSDFKLFTSGGSGIYFFGIEVYTNSQGPVVEACTLAGVSGVINIVNATTATINVTVPYATNLTSLIPNFTLASGTNFATPADETTPKDFSSPVAYTFTDGSDTRTYTITATRIPASTACNIISFSIPNQVAPAQFIPAAGLAKDSIIITMPYSTTPAQIAALVPTYTTSPLVSAKTPDTGVATDFTTPTSYTITAEDGVTTKTYWVRVQKAPASTACSITNFSTGFAKEKIDINQATGAISVIVDDGEIINNITPIITKSDLSSISPTGAQNFSSPVTYTVTAEDGVTQKPYTVTVTKDGNGPVLQSSNPEDDPAFSNAVVSLAGMITLTYNEDVYAGAGAVSISGTGTLGAASIVGKTVQIPFSGLTSLTNYTFTIPAGVFTDYFGNPVAAKSIRFRTADAVLRTFPYASHMDGASFAQPAFISGANYDINADSKATTTTQYGAYVLAPGQILTITAEKIGTILANVYAPGENRSFTITNNQNATVTNLPNISSYDNNGVEITQAINSNVVTEVYITNTSATGNIYIPYIYISDVNQPAVTEKDMWCK